MKKLKVLALVLAAALACMSLTACGGSSSGSSDNSGSSDASAAGGEETKTIVVATSPDFPPFESLENNEIVGIEVDIMDLIAQDLGMTVKYEQMDFDSVIPGVQAGKFDVGMSGITITEDRQKNCDFTNPYFMASQAIVVTPDSPITCKADLEGKKVSVQTGTTAEEYCMDNGYEVLAFTANNDVASALTTGKVDAWVVDNEVAVALAAQQGLTVLDEAMTSEPYAFAFAKGSDELVQSFNESLQKLMDDGSVQKIFDKYGVLYVAPEG